MHNIWLIAKREYTERIRTKAFIISTVLIPALMGGGIFGVAAIASKSKTTSHIAIVSSQPQPAQDLKQHLYQTLARYKVAHCEFRFVDSIPKSATGKILRKELRKSVGVDAKHCGMGTLI